MITGMYATSIGAHHMRTSHRNPHAPELPTPYEVVPPPYVKPITEYMRAAGYYCSNNAKTDYQFTPPCTAWDACGSGAHWRQRAPGQPFFAVFNLTVTHESGMWLPEARAPGRGGRQARPGGAERDEGRVATDPCSVALPPYLPDTPLVRASLARHYDNLALADAEVGKLLAALEADGCASDTVVMLWSDHGEGLPRAKRWLYDAGLRVPLIVRWPGHLVPGSVHPALVSMIDLGPTVLTLAGVPLPRHLQGQPFLGTPGECGAGECGAGEAAAPGRAYVYAARDRHDEAYDMVRAVRDRRYKYIRHFQPELPYLGWIPYRDRHPAMWELWRLHAANGLRGAQCALFAPRPPEELYDTETDPWEVCNLAGDAVHRPVLERLRAALDTWRRASGDLGDVPEDALAERMWPGGIQPHTAAPLFIPLGVGTRAGRPSEPAPTGGDFAAPLLLQLHCVTQGASIQWCMEARGVLGGERGVVLPGDDAGAPADAAPPVSQDQTALAEGMPAAAGKGANGGEAGPAAEVEPSGGALAAGIESQPGWHLYTAPLRLPLGRTVLRARSGRIGFADSPEVTATFVVRG